MLYHWIVFSHVVFVIGLCCTLTVEWTALSGMRNTREGAAFQGWSRQLQLIERLHPLWAIGIFGSGIYLTSSGWSWNTPFVVIGIAATLISAALGGALNGPRFKRLDSAAAALSASVPAVTNAEANDPVLRLTHGAQTGATISIFYLMIVKPGWAGSVGAVIVGILFGLLVASRLGVEAAELAKESR